MLRFFGLLLLVASWGFAQETLQEVRRQTKAAEKEMGQEKDLFQAEKKRHQEYAEVTRKKLAAFDDQASALRAQIDSLKAESQRLDEARKVAAGSSRWVEARKLKYQETLAKHLDLLANSLTKDFPFKNEDAVSSLRENAGQLRKGMIGPEEALGRAFDVLIDRIQMGYTSESWSGYFPWNGRSISGKYVRYGAVAAIFVAQDGEDMFWLLQGPEGAEWKAVGNNLALRATLKETLKVAEGKSPPSLVMLPFKTSKEAQP